MTRRKRGAATVRIGTSGWHYAHWKWPFYPASMPNHQFLSFYTTHYTTVELNNPFYRIPTEKPFAAWRENTPRGFLFAVKANRRFKHIKKNNSFSCDSRSFSMRCQNNNTTPTKNTTPQNTQPKTKQKKNNMRWR